MNSALVGAPPMSDLGFETDIAAKFAFHLWQHRVFSPAWQMLASSHSICIKGFDSHMLSDLLASLLPWSRGISYRVTDAECAIVNGLSNPEEALTTATCILAMKKSVLCIFPKDTPLWCMWAHMRGTSLHPVQFYVEYFDELAIASSTYSFDSQYGPLPDYFSYEKLSELPFSCGRRNARAVECLPLTAGRAASALEVEYSRRSSPDEINNGEHTILVDCTPGRLGFLERSADLRTSGLIVLEAELKILDKQLAMLNALSANRFDCGVVLSTSGLAIPYGEPFLVGGRLGEDGDVLKVMVGAFNRLKEEASLRCRVFPAWGHLLSRQGNAATQGRVELLQQKVWLLWELWDET